MSCLADNFSCYGTDGISCFSVKITYRCSAIYLDYEFLDKISGESFHVTWAFGDGGNMVITFHNTWKKLCVDPYEWAARRIQKFWKFYSTSVSESVSVSVPSLGNPSLT